VVYDFANEEVAATFGRDNFSLSTTYPARQLDKVGLQEPGACTIKLFTAVIYGFS
jgi:hypothetical protein